MNRTVYDVNHLDEPVRYQTVELLTLNCRVEVSLPEDLTHLLEIQCRTKLLYSLEKYIEVYEGEQFGRKYIGARLNLPVIAQDKIDKEYKPEIGRLRKEVEELNTEVSHSYLTIIGLKRKIKNISLWEVFKGRYLKWL